MASFCSPLNIGGGGNFILSGILWLVVTGTTTGGVNGVGAGSEGNLTLGVGTDELPRDNDDDTLGNGCAEGYLAAFLFRFAKCYGNMVLPIAKEPVPNVPYVDS